MAVDKDGEFTLEIRDDPPAHLMMKIESFSKLSKDGIQKQESSQFVAGTHKWRLIIYPQGTDISVFLSVADTETLPEGWEVTADCSILLHNQLSNNYFCFRGKARRFDAKNSRWGFSISGRMLAEACNGNGDDNCTFGAEVFLSTTVSLHDWKISDFSKLGDEVNSEEFLAGGFRWKMKLFPNGTGSAEGKSVSIYLECVDSETFGRRKKVKADFCIRIKNQLPHHSHHASKLGSHTFSFIFLASGFTHFIPITDVRDPSKGFIIDDCCFIQAEVSVQDVVVEEVNIVDRQGGWYIDTGATVHLCAERDKFLTYQVLEGSTIKMGNQASSEIVGVGDVKLRFTSGSSLTLKNVHYAPDIRMNIVSGSSLVSNGFKLVFESDKFILSKFDIIVGDGYIFERLFKLNVLEVVREVPNSNEKVYISS